MSLLFLGQTRCPLCGHVIETGQPACQFPAFVWNEADPLLVFSDASVHERCFDEHPLCEQVESTLAELKAKTGPGNRRCAVCAEEVEHHGDYLLVPRLTSDPASELARYNFTHLHRSHVRQWRELGELMNALRALEKSGSWKGNALRLLIAELQTAAA